MRWFSSVGSLVLGLLVSSCSYGQCDPGSQRCPAPSVNASKNHYKFQSETGEPRPWQTVVRITVQEPGAKTQGVGTGTIIDGSVPRALVMTAGHVIRASRHSTIQVEIFDGLIDSKGQLGKSIATFKGKAIDRDDKLDVGLVSFEHPDPLLSSPLVTLGFEPVPGSFYCHVGCSDGADPIAYEDIFLRRFATDQGYQALEFKGTPKGGRSGGGLFTETGRIFGVCDMAYTAKPGGLYADTSSLRTILKRNGFVDLSEGLPASMRPPAVTSPVPSVVAPETVPDPLQPPIIKEIERAGSDVMDLGKIMLFVVPPFGGIAFLMYFLGRLTRIQNIGNLPEFAAMRGDVIPPLEVLARQLAKRRKMDAEKAAQAESDRAWLQQIKDLEQKPASSPPKQ